MTQHYTVRHCAALCGTTRHYAALFGGSDQATVQFETLADAFEWSRLLAARGGTVSLYQNRTNLLLVQWEQRTITVDNR